MILQTLAKIFSHRIFFHGVPCFFVRVEGDVVATHQEYSSPGERFSPSKNSTSTNDYNGVNTSRIDPPDDEPPSLKIESMEENDKFSAQYSTQGENHALSPSNKPDIDDQGFFRMEPSSELGAEDGIQVSSNFSSGHISSKSESRQNQDQLEGFSENNFEGPEVDGTQKNVELAHGASDPIIDEKYPYSDEKKVGNEKDELDSDMNDSKEDVDELMKSDNKASSNDQPYNDIDPIDTSCVSPKGYDDSQSPYPFSPAGGSTNSPMERRGHHQSPAMRGAHEILKRNRRRRAES